MPRPRRPRPPGRFLALVVVVLCSCVARTGADATSEGGADASSSGAPDEATSGPSSFGTCPKDQPEIEASLAGPSGLGLVEREGDACAIESLTPLEGATEIVLDCPEDAPEVEPLRLVLRLSPAPSLAALAPGTAVRVWYEGRAPGQHYDCWYSYAARIEREDGALLLAAVAGCETFLDPFPPQQVVSGELLCEYPGPSVCGTYREHAIAVDLGDGLVGVWSAPGHEALGPYEGWAKQWRRFDKTFPCSNYPGWHRDLVVLRTSL